MVATGYGSNGGTEVGSSELALNRDSIVKIIVIATGTIISVKRGVVFTMSIGYCYPFLDVKVCIGNTWCEVFSNTADTIISNVYSGLAPICNCYPAFTFNGSKTIIRTSSKDDYDAMVENQPMDYVIRFTIKLTGVVIDNYNSIIIFTTGCGDYDYCYGTRVPGVWFDLSNTQLFILTGHNSDNSANISITF